MNEPGIPYPHSNKSTAQAEADSRTPSLDGLRALSIVLVLLGHLSGTQGFVRLNLQVGDYAHLGVVVFFVISGLLITNLLTAERKRRGRVSLQLFYARRALRLFPASFAYIGCVAVLGLVAAVQLHRAELWYALTYTVNYLPERSWTIGHLWSLSIEEQFYLFWPLAFVALSPRRALWVIVAGIAFAPVARAAAWFFLQAPYRDLEMFPMAADSLAIGCLLARTRLQLEARTWYLWLMRPAQSVAILALALLLNRYMGFTVVAVFGATVINVCMAVLVHRSVYHSDDWVGRMLNWKPVAFVGVLSYSLYLWQQLFLNRHSMAWVCAFPQNLGLAILAALGSYFLLEQPLLRLRRRLRSQ